MEALLAT